VTNSDQTPVQAPEGLQRRTVVKAGAHAAWAVPAITLATAAPAFAGSGTPSVSASGVSGTVTGTGNNRSLDVASTIANTGDGATTSLTVTYTITGASLTFGAPTGISAGWSSSSTGGTGTATYVFTRTGTQLAGGDSVPLNFSAPASRPNATVPYAGNIAVNPTPTPGSGTPSPINPYAAP